MKIDFATLSDQQKYKLLVGCVVPRPIALMSTISHDGIVNAAPYSFFNAICDVPPAVAVGVNCLSPGVMKDTAQNIRDTGEFVVNLVSEEIAHAMNLSAINFPSDVDEFKMVGFTHGKSVKVRPPFIEQAPISLECKRIVNVEIGIGRNVVLGEVVYLHIRDDLIDMDKLYVDPVAAGLIGRMHGMGWYARTTDLFDMPRVSDEKAQALISKSRLDGTKTIPK